jgi:hypothetical protein
MQRRGKCISAPHCALVVPTRRAHIETPGKRLNQILRSKRMCAPTRYQFCEKVGFLTSKTTSEWMNTQSIFLLNFEKRLRRLAVYAAGSNGCGGCMEFSTIDLEQIPRNIYRSSPIYRAFITLKARPRAGVHPKDDRRRGGVKKLDVVKTKGV